MSVPLQSLVFGQKSVVGSVVGGTADMVEMLDMAAVKGVRLIVETIPLSRVGAQGGESTAQLVGRFGIPDVNCSACWPAWPKTYIFGIPDVNRDASLWGTSRGEL